MNSDIAPDGTVLPKKGDRVRLHGPCMITGTVLRTHHSAVLVLLDETEYDRCLGRTHKTHRCFFEFQTSSDQVTIIG